MSDPDRQEQTRMRHLDSPEAGALLAAHGLSRRDLKRAVARFEVANGVRIRTWIGVNEAGFLGATRRGWEPGHPGSIDEFLVLIPWDRMQALLQQGAGTTVIRLIGCSPAPT